MKQQGASRLAEWQVGDFGVSQWTFTGTAADGSRIETDGVDVFAFRNGKIQNKKVFRKARPNLPATK